MKELSKEYSQYKVLRPMFDSDEQYWDYIEKKKEIVKSITIKE